MKNIKRKKAGHCMRSPLFLILFTLFSLLSFVSSATAQRPQNRMLSPEEASALGYDTGNPPGPYWKTERGVFELNGKDGPQPPNGPGYAGVGCDSRQDPAIYSSPNADPSKFKSWESGSCIENGKPCCVNIDLAGYPIQIGDPRYVIQDFQREQCKNFDQVPPFERDRLKKICDFIDQEKSRTLPSGSPITGSGDSPVKVTLEEARAAKQAAEQALANAQTKLEEVIATEQGAQDQLTTAQTLLDQATAAQQEAQQRFDDDKARRDQELQVAQQKVDEAQQEVDAAMNTLNEAQAELDALNQQIADAQNKVNDASTVKASAEQALQAALAEVSRITGLPVVGGNYGTSPIPPVDGEKRPPGGGNSAQRKREIIQKQIMEAAIEGWQRVKDYPAPFETFETYQPPNYADCERGFWYAVDSEGNQLGEGSSIGSCEYHEFGSSTKNGRFKSIRRGIPPARRSLLQQDTWRYVYAGNLGNGNIGDLRSKPDLLKEAVRNNDFPKDMNKGGRRWNYNFETGIFILMDTPPLIRNGTTIYEAIKGGLRYRDGLDLDIPKYIDPFGNGSLIPVDLDLVKP
jgi:hypothetical protein